MPLMKFSLSRQSFYSRVVHLWQVSYNAVHLLLLQRKPMSWVAWPLVMSAIMANHSVATSARAFQPGFSASHNPNSSTGLGIISEYRSNEST